MMALDQEGFACRCSDAERAASEERLRWAFGLLGIGRGDWFVSGAIMELYLRYEVDVIGLPVSQWYGVDYKPALSTPDQPNSSGRIQCDRIEDGLALLLWKAFEKWGEARPGSEHAADPEEPTRWRPPSDIPQR